MRLELTNFQCRFLVDFDLLIIVTVYSFFIEKSVCHKKKKQMLKLSFITKRNLLIVDCQIQLSELCKG